MIKAQTVIFRMIMITSISLWLRRCVSILFNEWRKVIVSIPFTHSITLPSPWRDLDSTCIKCIVNRQRLARKETKTKTWFVTITDECFWFKGYTQVFWYKIVDEHERNEKGQKRLIKGVENEREKRWNLPLWGDHISWSTDPNNNFTWWMRWPEKLLVSSGCCYKQSRGIHLHIEFYLLNWWIGHKWILIEWEFFNSRGS